MTTRTNDIARLLGTLALACTLCATGDETTNPETETPETGGETTEPETPAGEPATWTNVWITAAGGTWFATNNAGAYVNWQDGAITNNAVSRFRLDDGATVTLASAGDSVWGSPYSGGFDVGPAGETTAEVTPEWSLHVPWGAMGYLYPASELGYTPLHVTGGALTLAGHDYEWSANFTPISSYQRFRKTGDGTLKVQQFARRDKDRAQFTVAEGALVASDGDAFAQTDVRVTDAGAFTLAADPVRMGTLTVENDTTVDLGGRELVLGFTEASALDAGVTGEGRVTAAVRDLVVTNPVTTVEYGATAGRLRLDTATGRAAPYGRYTFETGLLTDDSGQNRALTMFGTVTRVWDEERQSWVARFDGSTSGLTATAPDSGLLSGDADYTVSLWAKVAQTPAANNWPTLCTIGDGAFPCKMMQFRFGDATCANLLIGHWGIPGDFTNLTAPAAPTAWHHYVVTRAGSRVTLWIDGDAKVQERLGAFRMKLPDSSRFTIGSYPPGEMGSYPRCFNGDIDDVCVYPFAVGAVGAARLYAGLDLPAQAGRPALDEAAPTLPEGLRLRTKYNGEIALAPGAEITVTNVLGGAQRGGFVLPRGGTLTLKGPGRYDAEVSGATDVVKAGADALTLGGRVNGTTHVQDGTLRLESARTALPLYVHYDFEESLTVDSGPERCDFEIVRGVTRAWDDERKSHVAVFSGAADQIMYRSATRTAFTGNADYTVSVWAKPDADCKAQGTFLSLGEQQPFRELVFRFNAMSAGSLVLSHWGDTFDFTDITSGISAPSGAWHHYAATHSGNTFRVYCDGKLVWEKTKTGATLNFSTRKALHLGVQLDVDWWTVGKANRLFKGRLDDVRVYTAALDAEAVARLAANEEPSVPTRDAEPAVALPTPAAHWSFEDADDIGRDTMGAHPLTAVGTTAKASLTRVASPLGGYAVQFPAECEGDRGGWLRTTDGTLCTGGGNQPFSFSMWVQTSSTDTRNGSDSLFLNPYFLTLGMSNKVGYLFGYWYDEAYTFASTRDVLSKEDGNTSINLCSQNRLPGLHDGDAALRWHHYARVYDPRVGLLAYVDGRLETDLSKVGDNIPLRDLKGFDLMLGGRLDKDSCFHGAIDEVRFYNTALTSAEVLAIMREDMARGRGVLPADAAVEIAAGATLQVAGSDETVGTFAGAGALALESGRVTVTGTTTLEGALTGDGTLRVADGAALTLVRTPTGFTGVFDMAGGALALPDGVAGLAATFRASAIDGTKQVAYPGDVEIPAGVSVAVTAENHGPLVSTAGRVTVTGGGTVTLPTAKSVGTWVIARGASVTASEDALAAWRASNAAASIKVRFHVTDDGDFVCQALGSATVIMVR